jgi:hypothetical protein
MFMPFAIVAMSAAPMSAFRISPRPPKRLVPPITAAEIASISSVPPPAFRSTLFRRAASTMPPRPDMNPEIMKTRIRIRGTLMPARRAASALPTDGVDVAAERRPLRDERPDQQHGDDEEQCERHASVLVADPDGDERDHGMTTSFTTNMTGSRTGIPCLIPE